MLLRRAEATLPGAVVACPRALRPADDLSDEPVGGGQVGVGVCS